MKKLLTLLALLGCLLPGRVLAQLPDGAIAPNWTLTDIDGVTHTMYDYLDQGKMVVLKFSATWCGPCWNYMLTGALETFWEDHGPHGDNQGMAFYIESDQNTGMDDLLGLTPSSQGNWVDAIPFPIIDLQWGENTDTDYQIAYYPTLYAVCQDRRIYELGQVPASEWEEFITSCALNGDVADVEPAVCAEDGSISLDVEGGVSPITYSWTNGAGNQQDPQNLNGGLYTVTITEGNNRSVVIEDIFVPGPDAPMALAAVTTESANCFEDPSGSVDIEMEEGTPPYTYAWSNGETTEDIVDVLAGTYTLEVTDDNGCLFEETFEVTQPDPIEATPEVSPEYCEQGNGAISLQGITGGVGNYEVTASAGVVFGTNILDLTAGLVTVTIEDGNGCLWEESIEVEYGPEPILFFSPDPEINCVEPTTLVSGYVTEGSGEYTYAWTTADGNIVGPTNQSAVTVDQPGTYQLEVYDLLTQCTVIGSSLVISNVELPAVEAGADVPITCESPQITLAGEGDPNYTVTWSTEDGNIVSGGNTYTPTVDQSGTYTITVVNPVNMCQNTDVVYVPDQTDPASSAYTYVTSDLTFIGTDISGGSNLSAWTWTFGDGNTSNEQSPVHIYTAAGTYEVCLTVENGCGTSVSCQTIEVTTSTSVILVTPTVGHVACFGQSTGTISIDVSGGSGTYTYLWTGPGGETYDTPTISDVPAGVYLLLITDDQGNTFNGVYTITEPDEIVLVGSTVVDNRCFGETQGSITVDITGGVGPFVYSFNGLPAQAENWINNLPGGQYECIVTDANGCSFLAGPYSIAEPGLLDAMITEVVHASNEQLNDGQITIAPSGGTPPYTVTWSHGATGTTVTGLAPGEYTYTVTDANGCVHTPTGSVTILGTVSTSEAAWAKSVMLAPNPSNGQVRVAWENLPSASGTLQLMTLDGRLIAAAPLNYTTGQWDLTPIGLQGGMYLVMIQLAQERVTLKMIVLD